MMKIYKIVLLIVSIALVWIGAVYFHRMIHKPATAVNRPPRLRAPAEPPGRKPLRLNPAPIEAKGDEFSAEQTAAMTITHPIPAPPTPVQTARVSTPAPPPESEEAGAVGESEKAKPAGEPPANSELPDGVDLLVITTAGLPPALAGVDYYAPLFAEGGTLPYSWKITSGTLPAGLALHGKSGYISGTPQSAGTQKISITVTGAKGQSSSTDYSLIIREASGLSIPRPAGVRSEPLYLVTGSLPEVQQGDTFSVQFEARGGRPPYTWSVSEGYPPAGISLSKASGLIAGVAKEVERAVFRVNVTDSDLNSDIAEYFINVRGEELVIITVSLEEGMVGSYYEHALEATGGLPPYQWSLVSGELHDGLALDSGSGTITGNPKEPGSALLVIRVTDTVTGESLSEFKLTISSLGLAIVTESLPRAAVNDKYEASLEADGGMPTYTWSLAGGKLPEGLSIDGASGLISGVPYGEVASSDILVAVTDQEGTRAQREFTINVDEQNLLSIENLSTVPSDRKVGLTWDNPENSEYSHTVIVRNSVSYPMSVEDGEIIYNGSDNSFLDTALSNDTAYFYAAIPYDSSGNPGSIIDGSKAKALPQQVTLGGPADPFADAVVSFQPLSENGFGSSWIPSIVLGPPAGSGSALGSLDVVSLHSSVNNDGGASAPYGGSITIRFDDNVIVNGDGVDFIVFENVFFVGGDPEKRWMEPAIVAVSQDGIHYYTFPYDFVPHYTESGEINCYNPYCYNRGFAGINPVYSNSGSPDPRDPSTAGGDPFDLSEITQANLEWVRYVRITATGDDWLTDTNGNKVRHATEMGACGGAGAAGFDFDAVCAVNY